MIVNYGRIFGWVKIKEWDSTDLVVWAGGILSKYELVRNLS